MNAWEVKHRLLPLSKRNNGDYLFPHLATHDDVDLRELVEGIEALAVEVASEAEAAVEKYKEDNPPEAERVEELKAEVEELTKSRDAATGERDDLAGRLESCELTLDAVRTELATWVEALGTPDHALRIVAAAAQAAGAPDADSLTAGQAQVVSALREAAREAAVHRVLDVELTHAMDDLRKAQEAMWRAERRAAYAEGEMKRAKDNALDAERATAAVNVRLVQAEERARVAENALRASKARKRK